MPDCIINGTWSKASTLTKMIAKPLIKKVENGRKVIADTVTGARIRIENGLLSPPVR